MAVYTTARDVGKSQKRTAELRSNHAVGARKPFERQERPLTIPSYPMKRLHSSYSFATRASCHEPSVMEMLYPFPAAPVCSRVRHADVVGGGPSIIEIREVGTLQTKQQRGKGQANLSIRGHHSGVLRQ